MHMNHKKMDSETIDNSSVFFYICIQYLAGKWWEYPSDNNGDSLTLSINACIALRQYYTNIVCNTAITHQCM